jgi:hypothetical protein
MKGDGRCSPSSRPIRPGDEIDNGKLSRVVKKMDVKTKDASNSSLSNCSGQVGKEKSFLLTGLCSRLRA